MIGRFFWFLPLTSHMIIVCDVNSFNGYGKRTHIVKWQSSNIKYGQVTNFGRFWWEGNFFTMCLPRKDYFYGEASSVKMKAPRKGKKPVIIGPRFHWVPRTYKRVWIKNPGHFHGSPKIQCFHRGGRRQVAWIGCLRHGVIKAEQTKLGTNDFNPNVYGRR